jgi:hypothetical protein
MKVKYVNQPKKPDGKFGNIKMETGETFFVNVGRLNLYRTGMEIEPPSKSEKWGDNVVQVIPANYDPTGGSAPNTPPPLSPSYNQASAPPPAQRTSGALGKEGEMFVMGVVGRAMGSGSFGVTDIDVLTKAAVQAWRNNVA